MSVLYISPLLTKTKCLASGVDVRWIRFVSHAKGGGTKIADHNMSRVFDSKILKSGRIKAFKHAVYQSAVGKGKANFSPMEVDLITRLVNRGLKEGGKQDPANSLQDKLLLLNKSLLTQRLSDKDILEGMNSVSVPVNVVIPRDITSQEEKLKVELQRRKLENIDLHPSSQVHIEELLRSLNIDTNKHEEIYREVSLYLQKNEDSKNSMGPSQHDHADIDLNSLKKYLQNIEKKAYQKNVIDKRKKNQTRIYEWSADSFSESVPLTAGNILFKRRPSRPLKHLANRISTFLNSNKRGKKVGNGEKAMKGSRLLLHSLDDNKDITVSAEFDYGFFNINFTDLFGVINASGYPPERVLDQINDIELKGWKCVGNLYDNTKTIVFQSSDPLFKEEGRASKRPSTARKTIIISITTSIVSLYAYYRYRLSQLKEAKVNSS
ncbi:Mrx4p DI49_5297 [Saccharomyces eubayanus]|uniref:Mrx4p n=1 Tax=Saccharomyces eubayanus TaxID=1080349 RepID=UPI0006C3862D|nr:hypothetical protein DI49_5297 [Saccharomyces eubayanus]KOG96150.1 hypothetical protein DI49_5297 [Saccharomyces eubayanus]